jgi:hypothetical protein
MLRRLLVLRQRGDRDKVGTRNTFPLERFLKSSILAPSCNLPWIDDPFSTIGCGQGGNHKRWYLVLMVDIRRGLWDLWCGDTQCTDKRLTISSIRFLANTEHKECGHITRRSRPSDYAHPQPRSTVARCFLQKSPRVSPKYHPPSTTASPPPWLPLLRVRGGTPARCPASECSRPTAQMRPTFSAGATMRGRAFGGGAGACAACLRRGSVGLA